MPRPPYKDRTKIKLRTNVAMTEKDRELAARIGNGNRSEGISKALKHYHATR